MVILTTFSVFSLIAVFIRDTFQHGVDFCKAQLLVSDILMIWILIGIFFVLSLIFFLMIILSRISKSLMALKKERLKKRFELLFIIYLFMDNPALKAKVVRHFQKYYLHKPFIRKVMMEEIINLHKDMAGDIKEKLKELYLLLGLSEDSYHKLADRRMHVKARGISELTQMEIKEALPQIIIYADHKSFHLRNKVQLAITKLSDNQNFNFLYKTPHLIPEWQELFLYEMILSLDKLNLPDFSEWTRSANISVVLFSLRMIKYFNQVDACYDIWPLLTHDNIDVRIEVIRIYAELQFVNDIELLKLMYPEENKKVKLEIIDALRKLGDEKTAGFLRRQFAEENNYETIMALSYACHSLLGDVTFLEDEGLNVPYDLHPYILHVTDPRI